jgi:SPP1 gp7 family putative phage head morphogenesis protein
MNNRTEWVTDANAEMKVIDFSGIGDNLTKLSEHDIEQIAYGMNIPLVLLGKANVAEGLAQVQADTFNRFIDSIRTIVEDVIEEKIFRPLLRSNNLDETIEFTWEITSEEEKKNKLMVLSDTMKNPFISPALKAALEKEYALVLGLDDLVKTLPTPEEAEEEDEIRREEEEEIQQPEVPGAKPTANEKAELITESEIKSLSEEDVREMSIAKYVNITELAGFNYTDYLVKILQKLKVYKFDELAAKSDKDIIEGLLPKEDINKLRIIIRDGFRKNKTIREIENQIKSSIDLKDRVRIEEDGTSRLLLSKESRPLTIARSETVRLANLGLKDLYDDNGIKQFRYLAPLDERTCEICGGLNGQVFNLKDGTPGINMPNMHANCRCTIIGLVE